MLSTPAGPGSAGPGSAGPGSAGPGSAGPGSAGPGLAGPGPEPGRDRGRRAAWPAVAAAVVVGLPAGGVAHAWLQVSQAGNYPSTTCQLVTAHWLRIYAPGETRALYVNHDFSACSSHGVQLLTVMPVRSGQGVQGSTP